MMTFVRINHFSDIAWQAHVLDIFFLVGIIFGVSYTCRQFKSGTRIYAVIMATAFVYGLILEIVGMLSHASYVQGEFLWMWSFTQFDLFRHSTDMPFYVPLFYPVWLLMAYKLVEPFGIRSPLVRAISIGFFCLILDVPYIINGGQPHVRWWEWHEWKYYQLWLTWPLLDGWWQMTWHAFLFWCIFKIMPRIDGYYENQEKTAYIKSLFGWPIAIALAVNIAGPVLHLPVTVPSYIYEGFRQYPIFALLVGIVGSIFLFSEKDIRGRFLGWQDVFLPAFHVMIYTVFVISNIVYECGFKDYILVQSAALFMTLLIIYYPRVIAKRLTNS